NEADLRRRGLGQILNGLGFDRQSMHALRDQISQGIIHKPMPLNVGQTIEATCADMDGKMRARGGAAVACMPDVGAAVVDHLAVLGLQGVAQGGVDLSGRDGGNSHGSLQSRKVQPALGASLAGSSGLMWRLRYTPWPSVNTSVRPRLPHILKLTQVSVGKLKATQRLSTPMPPKNSTQAQPSLRQTKSGASMPPIIWASRFLPRL